MGDRHAETDQAGREGPRQRIGEDEYDIRARLAPEVESRSGVEPEAVAGRGRSAALSIARLCPETPGDPHQLKTSCE